MFVQVALWRRVLEWEKGNPLHTDDVMTVVKRGALPSSSSSCPSAVQWRLTSTGRCTCAVAAFHTPRVCVRSDARVLSGAAAARAPRRVLARRGALSRALGAHAHEQRRMRTFAYLRAPAPPMHHSYSCARLQVHFSSFVFDVQDPVAAQLLDEVFLFFDRAISGPMRSNALVGLAFCEFEEVLSLLYSPIPITILMYCTVYITFNDVSNLVFASQSRGNFDKVKQQFDRMRTNTEMSQSHSLVHYLFDRYTVSKYYTCTENVQSYWCPQTL